MSGFHSSIAPSSLHLTNACLGSWGLIAGMPPQPDTPETIEGDVGHWVALQTAMGINVPLGTKYRDVEVDDDMLDGARLWMNTIGAGGAHEAPIWIPDIHPDCWGSADFWKWDEANQILYVADYKYGHLYVDEFENEQLMAYASGILRAMNASNYAKVLLTIVQPRCYQAKSVRTWTTTAGVIREHIARIAERVRMATDLSQPVLCTTGSHCTLCPAREICKTLQSGCNNVMTFSQHADSINMTPGTASVEAQLVKEAIKLLEARYSGLTTRIESYIKEGKRVPNWEMKNGRSNLAWNDPDKAIIEGDAIGVNLRKKIEPITPTQAKDRKLLDEETVSKLASRPPAPQKLAFVNTFSIRKALSGECS